MWQLITHGLAWFTSDSQKSVITHSTEGLKLLVWHKRSIQTKEENGGVRQQATQNDQVVHIGTRHFDQPADGGKHTADTLNIHISFIINYCI